MNEANGCGGFCLLSGGRRSDGGACCGVRPLLLRFHSFTIGLLSNSESFLLLPVRRCRGARRGTSCELHQTMTSLLRIYLLSGSLQEANRYPEGIHFFLFPRSEAEDSPCCSTAETDWLHRLRRRQAAVSAAKGAFSCAAAVVQALPRPSKAMSASTEFSQCRLVK